MDGQSKIDAQVAIQLLKQGKSIRGYTIEFTSSINALDAILLGKNGVPVPEKLIEYNDDDLDFDDDADITDEDFTQGRLTQVIHLDIPLDKEIKDWIQEEEINVSELVRNLLQGFYRTLKSIPK